MSDHHLLDDVIADLLKLKEPTMSDPVQVAAEAAIAKVKAEAKAAVARVIKAVGHRAFYMGLGAGLMFLVSHLL